ncbi:hypothetical protein TNCV_4687131 [Trichonephila clavipes]|nr:hypothetical protein TNCV_4687131 [Trichonephila clavipes]
MPKTGFQMLNNDEIVTSVQESDPVDDETDEDEDNESSKGPSRVFCVRNGYGVNQKKRKILTHQMRPSQTT